MIHDQTKKLAWSAPEHKELDRKPNWFWGIIIAGIVGIVLAILTKNLLLAFLILIAGVLMVLFSMEKPKIISVEISDQGIKIDRSMYRFESLKSFWLYQTIGGAQKLSIHSSQSFVPVFSVPLAQTIDPVILRDELLKHLPEEEHQESFADQVAERIGF